MMYEYLIVISTQEPKGNIHRLANLIKFQKVQMHILKNCQKIIAVDKK